MSGAAPHPQFLIVQFSLSIAWCGLRPLCAPLLGHIAKSPEIPLTEFMTLTKHPILLIWGDFILKEIDSANAGTVVEARRIFVEQYKLFATVANKYGGNVKNVILPEVGVFGNTHYPMADTKNAEVFRVVSQWLKGQNLDK